MSSDAGDEDFFPVRPDEDAEDDEWRDEYDLGSCWDDAMSPMDFGDN